MSDVLPFVTLQMSLISSLKYGTNEWGELSKSTWKINKDAYCRIWSSKNNSFKQTWIIKVKCSFRLFRLYLIMAPVYDFIAFAVCFIMKIDGIETIDHKVFWNDGSNETAILPAL